MNNDIHPMDDDDAMFVRDMSDEQLEKEIADIEYQAEIGYPISVSRMTVEGPINIVDRTIKGEEALEHMRYNVYTRERDLRKLK